MRKERGTTAVAPRAGWGRGTQRGREGWSLEGGRGQSKLERRDSLRGHLHYKWHSGGRGERIREND